MRLKGACNTITQCRRDCGSPDIRPCEPAHQGCHKVNTALSLVVLNQRLFEETNNKDVKFRSQFSIALPELLEIGAQVPKPKIRSVCAASTNDFNAAGRERPSSADVVARASEGVDGNRLCGQRQFVCVAVRFAQDQNGAAQSIEIPGV